MRRIGRWTALLLAFVTLGVGLWLPRDQVETAAAGFSALFVFALVTGVLPGPTTAAVFLAGSLLSPIGAGVVAALGSTIGETSSYAAGYGSHALLESTQRWSQRMRRFAFYRRGESWAQTYAAARPFVMLFIVGAVPNPVVDVAGFAAGRLGYSLPRFWLATLLGKSVRFVGVALLGAWLL